MKTRKILDIADGHIHYTCIKKYGEETPYYVYRHWRDKCDGSQHRKLEVKTYTLDDVLSHILYWMNYEEEI